MATASIADKTTMDSVNTKATSVKSTVESTATTVGTINTDSSTIKSDASTVKSGTNTLTTDTTTIKSRGGFKYDSTASKFKAYSTSGTWADVEFSGGSSGPVLVIENENGSLTGENITITHESGLFTRTIVATSDQYLRVEVPYTGKYYITCVITTVSVEVVGSGDTIVVINNIIPAFSTATWAEIETVCNAYYDGAIADLSKYWSVGDTKEVTLSAMSATGVGESHAEQTVRFAIIDFAHDNLTTFISGKSKAAITIQQVDSLNEKGYMNSTSTNVGGWTSSARRTWCNDVFYNALPSDLKSLVKPVNKLTSAGNQSSTINTDSDKCWFPSEIEVFNTTNRSKPGEGSQYPYYTTTANRIKKVNGSAFYWWLRSPNGSNSSSFVYCSSSGSVRYGGASLAYGLAPALCI